MKAARFDSQVPLQRSSAPLAPSVLSVRGDEGGAGRAYRRALWSRRGTVFLFAVLGAMGGLTVALQQEPFYRARTTIEILPPSQASFSDSGANIGYFLRTEVERLRSRNLMRTAIERLNNSQSNEVKYIPNAWQRLTNTLSFSGGRDDNLLLLAAQSVQIGVVDDSTVVQLQCDSPDPRLAANLLNALGVVYIDGSEGRRARLIDPAEPPTKLYDSKAWLKVLSGFGIGMLFGFTLIAASDRADQHFRSPLSASRALGLRLLGVISTGNIDPDAGKNGFVSSLQRLARGNYSTAKSDKSALELITFHRKPSLLAESFRNTLSSILLAEREGDFPQVLLVTSPGAGDGKTTVACNLAVALAEVKNRVLLIDGDMRTPRVHTIFDITNSWGLSEVLTDGTDLNQFPPDVLVKESRVPHVFLLPSGPAPVSVVTLMHSGRFGALLQRLRSEFDAIVIDSPPALDLGGGRLMSRHADGIVLVVRANRTIRTASVATVQSLAQDKTTLLGIVWNDWDPRQSKDEWSAMS